MRGFAQAPVWYHDGIHLDFRFDSAREHYVKTINGAVTKAPFTTLFTFTGDNKSYYMGPQGLLIPSVTNTPRIEYDQATGQCIGLKIESSRTNLGLYSADGTNAAWTKSNCSAAKTATGPDGVSNSATTLTATAGNGTCLQAITSTSANRVYSIWLKRRTGTGNIQLTVDNGSTWTTKTITSSWARYSITQSAVANPTIGIRIVTNGDAVDFWGSQLESAAFASSDIPTTSASIARAGETCVRTLSDEFSATAGTVAIRGRASPGQLGNTQCVYAIDDGTGNECIRLQRQSNTDLARLLVVDSSSAQAAMDFTFLNSTNYRHTVAWAANDFACSLNGQTAGTDSSGTLPSPTGFYLGNLGAGNQAEGHILTLDYYPVRLPNGFLTSW